MLFRMSFWMKFCNELNLFLSFPIFKSTRLLTNLGLTPLCYNSERKGDKLHTTEERVSFKNTLWQERMICNFWESLVSNLMQEILPPGWAALPKLETERILFREFPSKGKIKTCPIAISQWNSFPQKHTKITKDNLPEVPWHMANSETKTSMNL